VLEDDVKRKINCVSKDDKFVEVPETINVGDTDIANDIDGRFRGCHWPVVWSDRCVYVYRPNRSTRYLANLVEGGKTYVPKKMSMSEAQKYFAKTLTRHTHFIKSRLMIPNCLLGKIEALDSAMNFGLATHGLLQDPAEPPYGEGLLQYVAIAVAQKSRDAKSAEDVGLPLSLVRSWILDSGAALHIICRKSLGGVDTHPASKAITVSTANGKLSCREQVTLKVAGFTEPVSAYVLEATPDILSMGVLCMQHGYAFHWEPFSSTPLLIAPKGRVVVCSPALRSVCRSKDSAGCSRDDGACTVLGSALSESAVHSFRAQHSRKSWGTQLYPWGRLYYKSGCGSRGCRHAPSR